MKVTALPDAVVKGSYHATPTAPGVNTEGAHALSVPVGPSPSKMPAEIDHGPSTQPSMYQYPYPPKG